MQGFPRSAWSTCASCGPCDIKLIGNSPSIPMTTWVERTASEREYPAENAWLSLASYRAIPLGIPPQTGHFRFDRKLKNQRVASTLLAFESSEPRLRPPRSRSTTNFTCRLNTIVPFFSRSITLIVTRLPGAIEREPNATAETTK